MPTIRTELARIQETPLPELIEETKKVQNLICNNINFEQEFDPDSFELITLLLHQVLETVLKENQKLKSRLDLSNRFLTQQYALQKAYIEAIEELS